jgi:peptidoglycan/LPS O-acetylase OafA/YrhL
MLLLVYSYVGIRGWGQAHLWAICVEEHTIILLTLVLAVLGSRIGKYVLVALVPAALLVRWICFPAGLSPYAPGYWSLYTQSHVNLYPVLLGALLALFEGNRSLERVFARVPRHPAVWVAIGLLWALLGRLNLSGFSPRHFWTGRGIMTAAYWNVQPVITPAFMAFVVALTQRSRGSFFAKLLESRLLRGIGALYLGVYLWQQPFTVGFLSRPIDGLQLASAAALIALCAAASQTIVERPARRLQARLALSAVPPPSAG